MYPTFAGVVIPDSFDEAVLRPQQYGEEPSSVQVLRAQQYGYGDDGLMDGAEGLGIVQAQRLKAKLGRRGRRLRVGRSPYAVVGGSRYDFGFGVAPLAVAGAIQTVGGVIKKGTPRLYGYLPATINAMQYRVEGGLGPTRGVNVGANAAETIRRIHAKRNDKTAGGVWHKLLPTWNPTPQARALLRQLGHPAFQVTAVGPAPIAPPSIAPPAPGIVPTPAPGPILDAGGGPAPSLPPVPSPIPPGGPPSPTEEIAADIERDQEPKKAGLFGDLDVKGLMPLALIGVGALILSQAGGGGRRRRRRR